MQTVRLKRDDRDRARTMFATMALVFGEEFEALGDDYIDGLLARDDFWAIAAIAGNQIIGGLTAYTLPMARKPVPEIFIYDIAVRPQDQRKGVGRSLVTELLNGATASGVSDLFVAADNDDVHALDFYRALGGAPAPVTFFTWSRINRDPAVSSGDR